MLVALLPVACSNNSPTAPTTPQTWSLTGTVQRPDTGTLVVGATLDVLDGLNADRTATTNTSGVYVFLDLQAGSFSIRARHADYHELAQGASLTADRPLDFRLMRAPRADQKSSPVRHTGRCCIARCRSVSSPNP